MKRRSKLDQPPASTDEKHLKPEHEAFVRAYLSRGRDIVSAYRSVYGHASTEQVARASGYKLLRHPLVKPRINAVLKAVEHETEITVARIQEELAKLAFSDIRQIAQWGDAVQVLDQDGNKIVTNGLALISSAEMSNAAAAAISEIVQRPDGSTRIKLHPKMQALDSLARMAGLYDNRASAAPDEGETYERRREARRLLFSALQDMAAGNPAPLIEQVTNKDG